MNDADILEKKELRILASHEVIIPRFFGGYVVGVERHNFFLMTLSKRVPVFVKYQILSNCTVIKWISIWKEKRKYYTFLHYTPADPKS
jgi:hypothetical protein